MGLRGGLTITRKVRLGLLLFGSCEELASNQEADLNARIVSQSNAGASPFDYVIEVEEKTDQCDVRFDLTVAYVWIDNSIVKDTVIFGEKIKKGKKRTFSFSKDFDGDIQSIDRISQIFISSSDCSYRSSSHLMTSPSPRFLTK